jgi:hypothetical protein
MHEARYIIRLENRQGYVPSDHDLLLRAVRAGASPLKGRAMNLRVSSRAVEFDLFCASDLLLDPFITAWRELGGCLTVKRLDVPPTTVEAPAVVAQARDFFNEERYWEVHEILEALWKERTGSEKQLLQGLILTAAALVHRQKNEGDVARIMLSDAVDRLKDQPTQYYGWDIQAFRNYFIKGLASQSLETPTV